MPPRAPRKIATGNTTRSSTGNQDAGVQSFSSKGDDKGQPSDPASQIDSLMSKLESSEGSSSSQPPAPLVTTGTGLPKKLIARVLANEYIDFSELPLVKGKGRPMPQSLEGQVIVVQVAELLQARRIISNLATWMQCFSIYAAVVPHKTELPTRLSL